ncbi:ribosome maturation factor RimM [Oscillatoriales cyanobacterium LEGE 11467]|uniref:Ribosome maturation factor RimM n=1 Tax=Zarconia navalis LEGE 11467 TaxID=1828826 RepID=A0A928VX43_9CYAN|nr:ribosome maturation factor RimM [Zarconia navalis]MBE9039871.1 ribosome maturation factor RimM [Zarconia navalis LEGE 11467]
MTDEESPSTSWLQIGKIVSPQGLRGQLRVYPNSDFPERFLEPGTRWLQRHSTQEPEKVELLNGREIPGKKLYVITLAGVETREAADAFRGALLLVPQDDRLELDEDEYHVLDIVGLMVFHRQTGTRLGTVVDVMTAGHDLLQVKLDVELMARQSPEDENLESHDAENSSSKPGRKKRRSKKKKAPLDTVLIPFVWDIVPVIDLENDRIEIDPPPGLLDLRFH